MLHSDSFLYMLILSLLFWSKFSYLNIVSLNDNLIGWPRVSYDWTWLVLIVPCLLSNLSFLLNLLQEKRYHELFAKFPQIILTYFIPLYLEIPTGAISKFGIWFSCSSRIMRFHHSTDYFGFVLAGNTSSILYYLWLILFNDPSTSFRLVSSSSCIVGKLHPIWILNSDYYHHGLFFKCFYFLCQFEFQSILGSILVFGVNQSFKLKNTPLK